MYISIWLDVKYLKFLIKAVEYHTNNYKIIKTVVNSFDEQNSFAIKNVQKIFKETDLEE